MSRQVGTLPASANSNLAPTPTGAQPMTSPDGSPHRCYTTNSTASSAPPSTFTARSPSTPSCCHKRGRYCGPPPPKKTPALNFGPTSTLSHRRASIVFCSKHALCYLPSLLVRANQRARWPDAMPPGSGWDETLGIDSVSSVPFPRSDRNIFSFIISHPLGKAPLHVFFLSSDDLWVLLAFCRSVYLYVGSFCLFFSLLVFHSIHSIPIPWIMEWLKATREPPPLGRRAPLADAPHRRTTRRRCSSTRSTAPRAQPPSPRCRHSPHPRLNEKYLQRQPAMYRKEDRLNTIFFRQMCHKNVFFSSLIPWISASFSLVFNLCFFTFLGIFFWLFGPMKIRINSSQESSHFHPQYCQRK